jgi:hypothetical protein
VSADALYEANKFAKAGRFSNWITLRFWRLLRRSLVFRYWYKSFLTELLFELERFDIEGESITQKYRDKLEAAKRNWK